MSNLHRAETHVIRDYPKWIDHNGERLLVKSADEERELVSGAEDETEHERMIEELESDYGKTIDRRKYRKDAAGFAKLKAYYEAVIDQEDDD